MNPKVLICDDDPLIHMTIKHRFKGRFEFRSAYHSDEALVIVRTQAFDLVLLDVQMRTKDEGLRAIPLLKAADPTLPIVVLSGLTDMESVREAMKLGAKDYLPKDFNSDEFECSLKNSLRSQVRVAEAPRKRDLIGESSGIKRLRELIGRFRTSSSNVVITGETGTGKEVVARQLRRTLPDGNLEPFIAVDSATIQSSTAESVLFGYEKGAFTGAEKTTKGLFEEAHGGLIYFDEISNMPLEIQAKLLRVIQEKEVTRLGSARPLQLDFRVICATNRNLEQMVIDGKFKDDLLQRLSVLPVELPPLRERAGDIPLLLAHFSERLNQGREIRFSDEAIATLQKYSWPGNIRELSNLVSFLTTMLDGDTVRSADLPAKFRTFSSAPTVDGQGFSIRLSSTGSFYDRMLEVERELLTRSYIELRGNVSQMSRILSMDRSHLHSKLKRHGIAQ